MILLLEEIAKVAIESFFDEQLYANIPCVQIDMEKFSTISKVFLTLLIQTSVRVSQHAVPSPKFYPFHECAFEYSDLPNVDLYC